MNTKPTAQLKQAQGGEMADVYFLLIAIGLSTLLIYFMLGQ